MHYEKPSFYALVQQKMFNFQAFTLTTGSVKRFYVEKREKQQLNSTKYVSVFSGHQLRETLVKFLTLP